MKFPTTMQNSMFIHHPFPPTTSWHEDRRFAVKQPRVLSEPTLSTDELAATKPEIVCSGILGLCLFYTLIHCLAQLAA